MITKTIQRSADGSVSLNIDAGTLDALGRPQMTHYELRADQVDAHRNDATFIDAAADAPTLAALNKDKADRLKAKGA